MSPLPSIVTLGSLIIDDIIHQDGSVFPNVLGGAGSHTVYGARVWLPPPLSRRLGFLVQLGFDFPPELYAQLESLDVLLRKRQHDDHSPRAWNRFERNDRRGFEYQHPNIKTWPSDFPVEWVRAAKVVHLIAGKRALEILKGWATLGGEGGKFVWEPLPEFSTAENWEVCKAIMCEVDVVTPNHEEAATLLGESVEEIEERGVEGLNWLADRFLEAGVGRGGGGCVVIRAGWRGCLVATRNERHFIPAYWDAGKRGDGTERHPNVRDVTGAGNSFCGGFAVGMIEHEGDYFEAGLYGSVSSSFTVEQVGVPRLRKLKDGGEMWNKGPGPQERLAELRKRISKKT